MIEIDWWALGRDVIMMVVAAFVFYWGRERKQTAELIDARFERLKESIESDFELRDHKIDQIFLTLERANIKSSELAGYVQALIGRVDRLPEELRGKFFPGDRAADLIDESRRDRANLWRAIGDVKKISEEAKRDREQIWKLIERRHTTRGGFDNG